MTSSLATHCRTLLLGTLGGMGLLGPPSLAAAPAAQPAAAPPSLRDARLAMNARQALARDEQLARLNIGISVRQGVATIWGPVPSEAVARRAVERLREVKGLLEVRSQLYLKEDLEPAPRPSGQPPLLPLEPPAVGALLGRRGDVAPAPGETLRFPRDGADLRTTPYGEEQPVRSPASVVSLLPPVSPAETDAARDGLSPAIEQLWRSDLRYRVIRPQVQGGVVYLHGMAARREEMLDLAERIARLAGVERVILKERSAGPGAVLR